MGLAVVYWYNTIGLTSITGKPDYIFSCMTRHGSRTGYHIYP